MNSMIDDKEHAAIGAVIHALSELNDEERERVIEYMLKRYGIKLSGTHTVPIAQPKISMPDTKDEPDTDHVTTKRPTDIRQLKIDKKPTSDSQMAVLVAYYLKVHAPDEEKKEVINASDIENYFTQADYSLPTGVNGARDTLKNAKNAGYMESPSRGLYKLNRVGFNLAAYNMPTTTALNRGERRVVRKAKKGKKK